MTRVAHQVRCRYFVACPSKCSLSGGGFVILLEASSEILSCQFCHSYKSNLPHGGANDLMVDHSGLNSLRWNIWDLGSRGLQVSAFVLPDSAQTG